MNITIEEKRNWILEHCLDEDGDIDLKGLDFSDFEGNIYLNHMKVKKKLYQRDQNIQGDLYQCCQKVQGDLFQDRQTVQKDLYQCYQKVRGELVQDDRRPITMKELEEIVGCKFCIVEEKQCT